MKRSYENLTAWRSAGHKLAGTLLITALAWSAAAEVPVTQAVPESPPPKTLSLSSPAGSEIIKMAEAKVDPAVIKAYIQSSTVAYNLGASDLIAMKNHGVSDEIVTAMLEHTAQLRSQMAQAARAAQQVPAEAPAYGAPAPAAPYTAPAAYEPNPSDYGTYAPYADYGYSYPYYPYNYWYSYGYPSYYSYPYCGYYGHYYPYCGYHGHGYYGCYYHNGHWYHQHSGSPGHPHSTGTFAHSTGVGHSGNALSPVSNFHGRPASFAMSRSAAMGTGGGVRVGSVGVHGGGTGFHGGGGASAHGGGGGGHMGGGGRR